jgi:diaminopimelate epimerase
VTIPFTKAHGALNDFLLTWSTGRLRAEASTIAKAICDRHAGIGADGWILVSPPGKAQSGIHGSIELWNSDGSPSEISGNGTRCAAAFLVDAGIASEEVRICTGAGEKTLHLQHRTATSYTFEMDMGTPRFSHKGPTTLQLSAGERETIIMDVGNPQCALLVENFDLDWRALGAEIERHPHFPNRTNVSFVRVVDRHRLDVRFYERGAGETMSSGTGSTGAVAAALLLELVESPVTVNTPAGPLQFRIEGSFLLTGPATLVGGGEFYM